MGAVARTALAHGYLAAATFLASRLFFATAAIFGFFFGALAILAALTVLALVFAAFAGFARFLAAAILPGSLILATSTVLGLVVIMTTTAIFALVVVMPMFVATTAVTGLFTVGFGGIDNGVFIVFLLIESRLFDKILVLAVFLAHLVAGNKVLVVRLRTQHELLLKLRDLLFDPSHEAIFARAIVRHALLVTLIIEGPIQSHAKRRAVLLPEIKLISRALAVLGIFKSQGLHINLLTPLLGHRLPDGKNFRNGRSTARCEQPSHQTKKCRQGGTAPQSVQ